MATSKRPRKRTEKREELTRRIMDVSLDLFLKQGYDKTTTRQIIQGVGILNGSLYNIFESKDEILAALLVEAMKESLQQGEKYVQDKDAFSERILFPICLTIHAASKHERIAEILAVANKNWDVMMSATKAIYDFIESTGSEIPIGLNECRGRMYLASGLLGNLMDMQMHETESVDPLSAMYLAADIVCRVFDIDEDLSSKVDRYYSVVTTEDITICGVSINAENLSGKHPNPAA